MSFKRRYKNILQEWGRTCIICGEKIDSYATITREHIIPKCMIDELGLSGIENNIACSHYKCNCFRRAMPIYPLGARKPLPSGRG